MMKSRLEQALTIIAVAVILGFGVNIISANRIPFIGKWPSISGSDTVAVPPSAEEGDPLFISLDEAAARYQSRNVVFVDARDPEDFEYGRVAGAINLPYDYIEDYWENVVPLIPRDNELVIYCSGTECEQSLFLAREFVYQGYEKVFIFYGGWREWERAGLPTEERE